MYDDFLQGFGVGEPMKAINYSTESIVVPNSSSIDDLFSCLVEIGMFVGISSSSRFVVDETNLDYRLIWYVKMD
jgi:hypothetical protein